MRHEEFVHEIADILKQYDQTNPVHSRYKPGIGPFTERKLVKYLCQELEHKGLHARAKNRIDIVMRDGKESWAIEFKVARPFGDNGNEAENWTVNLLHPYIGNQSLIADALKLESLDEFDHRCLVALGFEHDPPQISLEPLFRSFETLASNFSWISNTSHDDIMLGERVEVKKYGLVHPHHKVLRCASWMLIKST